MLCNLSCRETSIWNFLNRRGFLSVRYFLLEILKVDLYCDAINAGGLKFPCFCDDESSHCFRM